VTGAFNRGVDDTLVASRKDDTRMIQHAEQSYVEELLSAGVRLLRYPFTDLVDSTSMLVDGDDLTIGSPNIDIRALSQNGEAPHPIIDPEVGRDAVGVLDGYAAVSDQLDLHDWRARPWHEKYRDNVFRLMSGVL